MNLPHVAAYFTDYAVKGITPSMDTTKLKIQLSAGWKKALHKKICDRETLSCQYMSDQAVLVVNVNLRKTE